tara:strand:- start:2786 stop:3487 length:702 start_codon:yes stop_codon:yes gene_type:complete
MTEDQQTITHNIARIRERMAEAAHRAGRSPENISLIAVTKYVDIAQTRSVALAGLRDLGESRPQMLWEKSTMLEGESIRWHLVGHLQRNKVARTVASTHLIHSVDSVRLLKEINRESKKIQRVTDILLEINVSNDKEKHGFLPAMIGEAMDFISQLSHVRVHGLMAMASREGGRKVAQQEFAAVRNLRDRLSEDQPENVSLDELSLGMSGDMEEAILEGATMVRIGRALFEKL